MVVEARVSITRKEFEDICLKLTYRKPFALLLSIAAVVCSILIIINVYITIVNLSGNSKIFDDTNPLIPSLIVISGITLPIATYRHADKTYHSTLMLQLETTYRFDNEKISWQRDGAEGYFVWKYFTHSQFIGKFLLLYTGANAIFIKKESLTQEEITFIQSNIKSPGE